MANSPISKPRLIPLLNIMSLSVTRYAGRHVRFFLLFGYCISSRDLGIHFTPLMTFRLYSVHWALSVEPRSHSKTPTTSSFAQPAKSNPQIRSNLSLHKFLYFHRSASREMSKKKEKLKLTEGKGCIIYL